MAKVRLADIAAQVGVSTVTVHNALTGQKGVSDELRARIQKVAGSWITRSSVRFLGAASSHPVRMALASCWYRP